MSKTHKICTVCKTNKLLNEFGKRKAMSDGHRSECKKCNKKNLYEYRRNNPHIVKKINDSQYAKHAEKIKAGAKIYRDTKQDKEKANQYFNAYIQKRSKEDMNFRLARNLRTRIYHAIKECRKSGSAIKDLGCSLEELKIYLESKFQLGMTWENYGEWHIDHIFPLSKFNLENREEFLKASHYSNLQPLWAMDNLMKGNKVG